MFFALFSLCFADDPAMRVFGKWGESLPYDETVLFFEYVRPDLTPFVDKILGEEAPQMISVQLTGPTAPTTHTQSQ